MTVLLKTSEELEGKGGSHPLLLLLYQSFMVTLVRTGTGGPGSSSPGSWAEQTPLYCLVSDSRSLIQSD